ncbi:MAG: hypothetical protein KF732_09135 [Flavobacteriales bacterium]|nr:hypothetical protein [Flavobacteriales bacterium]
MKNILLTLIILAFYSCQTKTAENKVVDNSVNKIQTMADVETETTDEFCDTTKIKDFKSNLTILTQELTDKEREYQLKKAKDFIKKSCEQDTLYCGEIKLKKSTTYKFDNEWKLLLTGYILDQETGMEENSASFFVLTILRNNEFWFTDILEDLIGEIQVELSGFEDKDRQVTLWGTAYPYFQPDYGKFRLTINNGATLYEFQCHSQH